MMPDLPARLRASLAGLSLVSLASIQVLHGAVGASGAGARLERTHSESCAILHNEALCPLGVAGLLAPLPAAVSQLQPAAQPVPVPPAVPAGVRRAAVIRLPFGRAPPLS